MSLSFASVCDVVDVCRWVLWYFKPDKNRGWTDNLKEIIGFDTVSVMCAIVVPNHLFLLDDESLGEWYSVLFLVVMQQEEVIVVGNGENVCR